MTTYILHGGFTRVKNELNQTFFREIASATPDNGTILMCFFASGSEDKTEVYNELSVLLHSEASGKNSSTIMATPDDFLNQVASADVIYLHGGNTNVLLKALAVYPGVADLWQGKTIAGSSAGAYVIGQYSAFHDDESGGQVREGLGLLPLRVVCHYESETLPPNPDALKKLEATAPELDIVYLKDFEWKVFTIQNR